MSRISYVNGSYLPHSQAAIAVEDRGLQFADSVYEVIEVFNRRMVDAARHLDRLERSLRELEITMPMSRAALELTIRQLLERNSRLDSLLYVQISRGTAAREHGFPKKARSNLIMTVNPARTPPLAIYEKGIEAITIKDIRWGRCDIKTTGLLGNVLAKNKATSMGAKDAILFDENNMVREGTSSNLFIVAGNGELWTHPLSERILGGITRTRVMEIAAEHQLAVKEKTFSVSDMMSAREVFLTSSSTHVLPVVKIDGKPVGDGKPGITSRALLESYDKFIFEVTGKYAHAA